MILYDMISLYQFVAMFGLATLGAVGLNSYAAFLLLVLLLMRVPSAFLNMLPQTARRPLVAKDCGILNKGGDFFEVGDGKEVIVDDLTKYRYKKVKDAAGRETYYEGGTIKGRRSFASDHVSVATFLMVVQISESIKGANKNAGLLIFSTIMVVLTMWTRYANRCSSPQQVGVGFVVGALFGVIFMGIENQWLNDVSRYAEDKARFYELFNL